MDHKINPEPHEQMQMLINHLRQSGMSYPEALDEATRLMQSHNGDLSQARKPKIKLPEPAGPYLPLSVGKERLN